MNSVDPGLTISLIVLTCITSIFLVVIGAFLIKLLYDLSKLAQTANSTTEVIQTELEPTLKELREAAGSLKNIANGADSNITNFKNTVSGAFDASFKVGQKVKGLANGLLKGLLVGLKIFKK